MKPDALDRLKRKINITVNAQDLKLNDMLVDAEDAILAHTKRVTLPTVLDSFVERIALIWYNREGIEGETSHSEGGISRSIEALPSDILNTINEYRVAKTVM